MSARGKAVAVDPGTVLRRALLAWGLGHLALGRTAAGIAWLLAEILAATALVYLFIGLVDTTWYLVPFLAGVLFLVAWSTQAALAFRAAARRQALAEDSRSRAAAAGMAWLTVPLLLWGTGFWLVAGSASSPAATLDRFEASWPDLVGGGALDPGLGADAGVSAAARGALATLRQMCASGELSGDCSASARNLLRDVRITIAPSGPNAATAMATVVSFERRPSQFLSVFAATELVPVPSRTVLTLQLRAASAPLPGGLEPGAQRWRIIGASPS